MLQGVAVRNPQSQPGMNAGLPVRPRGDGRGPSSSRMPVLLVAMLALTGMQALLRAETTPAQYKFVEQKITSWDKCWGLSFSADGRHYAYAQEQAGKWVVILDGERGPAFDEIRGDFAVADFSSGYCVFDTRSAFFVWEACRVQAWEARRVQGVDDGDGKRVVYGARKDGKWFAVVDGKPGPAYDKIGTIHITQDRKRFFHTGTQGTSESPQFIVIDGKESPVIGRMQGQQWHCSPHGNHIWYISRDPAWHLLPRHSPDSRKAKFVVVVDETGQPFPSYDGKAFVYTARIGTKWSIVVDGKPGSEQYDRVGQPFFSPDEGAFVYTAMMGTKWSVVVNGKPGAEQYEEIGQPFFSPDGKALVYAAKIGTKWSIVVDGKPGAEQYDHVAGLHFSRDGKHLVGIARSGDKQFVVLDGAPGPKYNSISEPVRFTQGGNSIVYLAETSPGKWCVVVDGKEGAQYEITSETKLPRDPQSPYGALSRKWIPCYVRDERRVAYVVPKKDGWCVVVDGKPDPESYERVSSVIFSRDGKRYAYAANEGRNAFAVVDGTPGKAYGGFSGLQFSPDGKRYAYWAEDGPKKRFLVVDGQPSVSSGGSLSELSFSPDGKHVAAEVYLGSTIPMNVAMAAAARGRRRTLPNVIRDVSIEVDGLAGPAYGAVEARVR
jgi:hypothetical protein